MTPTLFMHYSQTGIVVADKTIPQNNYTIIPNEITRSKELLPESKALIIYLLGNSTEFAIHKTTLPKMTGMSRGRVKKAFDQLTQKGYIVATDIRSPYSGQFVGVRYLVYSIPHLQLEIQNVPKQRNSPDDRFTVVGEWDL